jgi:hypothetical protein
MSTRLTADDTASFTSLAAALAEVHPRVLQPTRKQAQVLADLLRENLGEDVDDVLLGRVLLYVGGYVGAVARTPEIDALTDTVLVAACDLTALERGEMPSA